MWWSSFPSAYLRRIYIPGILWCYRPSLTSLFWHCLRATHIWPSCLAVLRGRTYMRIYVHTFSCTAKWMLHVCICIWFLFSMNITCIYTHVWACMWLVNITEGQLKNWPPPRNDAANITARQKHNGFVFYSCIHTYAYTYHLYADAYTHHL